MSRAASQSTPVSNEGGLHGEEGRLLDWLRREHLLCLSYTGRDVKTSLLRAGFSAYDRASFPSLQKCSLSLGGVKIDFLLTDK